MKIKMKIKMEETQARSLAAAILLRAVDEWEDPEKHLDVERFIKSEWFNELAEFVHFDPNDMRSKILSGTYQTGTHTRAPYR